MNSQGNHEVDEQRRRSQKWFQHALPTGLANPAPVPAMPPFQMPAAENGVPPSQIAGTSGHQPTPGA